MLRFHPVPLARLPFRAACLLAALVASPLSAAQAAVNWHADLATAKAAAAASDRPVLAVFTASWTPAADATAPGVLASPEAEAVVSACFEPVRIDIDAHPELTKELGVSHVPSVCIIAADDVVLSRFELPASTPAFVAVAAKAAQAAAAHRSTAAVQSDVRSDLRIRVSSAGESTSGNAFATATPSAASPATPAAAPGSISLVTAKVRELSDFANEPPPAVGSGFRPIVSQVGASQAVPSQAVAAAAPQQQQQATFAPLISAPYPDPAASRSPAGWRTETATAPLAQVAPPTASRPTLEPAAPPAPQAAVVPPASPWLTTPPTAAGVAAAAPAATAGALPAPATPALPDTTAPAEPPKSLQAQFLAAIQKPFTFWQKSPEVPKPSAAALAAAPPTMPPARPLPLGAVPSATTAAAPGPETPDTYGSMPLGLEGYCPVTLAEKGQWAEGRAQWGARHRGRTYLFAGEDQQRAFLADPDRYSPALSGDDPVLAFESGTTSPGQRRYGVTYQSRMYLFSSPETRSRFAADPTRYAGRVALAEAPTRSNGTILR
jgi:YHS domain-containing protein